MAMQRLSRAALDGSPFTLHGDGRQIRDFTFVADVVAPNVSAISADVVSRTVVNISGGSSTDMLSVISQAEVATQRAVNLLRSETAPGDVRQTGGNNSQARALRGWVPAHSLTQGVAEQAAFEMSR